ncbi:helix-turn-helix transcriptional regulator [Micrococcus luteus]|uniref:helix-turn-helix domain-containing protein n=1 Tax=Micrococcus luteus TaxID=1270 RepID=UPI001409BE0E|nr:helix-turn-helix transcriptional regulator [Micrococcus luteus]NHQ58873.1 helix-turn-helix transcriptional regulator [Micrococcus luteus]
MTKSIEEVIGENVRHRREALNWSQAQLGERVGALLGVDWKPQTVSGAEKGRRQFIAAELVVLAHVLGCRVQDLVTVLPPQPVRVTEHYIQQADPGAPFQRVGPATPSDPAGWFQRYAKAQRELSSAVTRAKEIRRTSKDLVESLHYSDQLLNILVREELFSSDGFLEGAEPLPYVDPDEFSDDEDDGSPSA